MNPCTSSSFAPLNVNDSNGCMSICDNSASFMCVTGRLRMLPISGLLATDPSCADLVGRRDRHSREEQSVPVRRTRDRRHVSRAISAAAASSIERRLTKIGDFAVIFRGEEDRFRIWSSTRSCRPSDQTSPSDRASSLIVDLARRAAIYRLRSRRALANARRDIFRPANRAAWCRCRDWWKFSSRVPPAIGTMKISLFVLVASTSSMLLV